MVWLDPVRGENAKHSAVTTQQWCGLYSLEVILRGDRREFLEIRVNWEIFGNNPLPSLQSDAAHTVIICINGLEVVEEILVESNAGHDLQHPLPLVVKLHIAFVRVQQFDG